jgi:hypothetical protein
MMQAIDAGEPEADIKPKMDAMPTDTVTRLTSAKY